MDIGTSWRPGTRFGPKAGAGRKRDDPALSHGRPGAAPFDSLQVADIGDLAINTFSLSDSLKIIASSYDAILNHDVMPMAIGGDHSITLPVLRAIAKRHGPVALVHVDAHADVNEHMFGEKETHGTVFRRAYEEGLIVPEKTYQVGLRGTGYGADDFKEAAGWGFQQFPSHELWHRPLDGLAAEIRRDIGKLPTYVTFDIDSLDPAYAPGTGTPEIGGLTTPQALQLIRALRGVNIVGCDLVEVSPPYDTSGNTALTGANILYELLCVLPGVTYR